MRTSIKSLMTGVLMLAGLVHAGNAMAADGSFEVINSNNNVSIQAVWVAGAGLPNDPWSSITPQLARWARRHPGLHNSGLWLLCRCEGSVQRRGHPDLR